MQLAEAVCAASRQMLDNFGNFASWTEWSLAFNLFFKWRPDPKDPSKRIQARSSLAWGVVARAVGVETGRHYVCGVLPVAG